MKLPEFHLEVWAMNGGAWGWQMRAGGCTSKGGALDRAAAWQHAFMARAVVLAVCRMPAVKPWTA